MTTNNSLLDISIVQVLWDDIQETPTIGIVKVENINLIDKFNLFSNNILNNLENLNLLSNNILIDLENNNLLYNNLTLLYNNLNTLSTDTITIGTSNQFITNNSYNNDLIIKGQLISSNLFITNLNLYKDLK